MEIDRRELKRQAREAIRVSRPSFWVVTLVYLLMTTGVSTLAGLLVPAPDTGNISLPALFLSILLSLYSTVVGFGFTLWSMWTSRKLSPGLGSLADGFSVALLVIMTSILIFLHMLAWSLLCIPVVWLVLIPVLLSPSLSFLVIPVLIAGIMIFSYWVSLRYALAYYLLADHPDHGAFAAVRRSVELTRGWKWEMFKLFFSFLGWELLDLLLYTLVLVQVLVQGGFFQALSLEHYGAAYVLYQIILSYPSSALLLLLASIPVKLWLYPYRSVTMAGFYDARLRLQREGSVEMPPL
ncbi:hypothetical protein I4100191B2_24940 [Clostridiales bacterium]